MNTIPSPPYTGLDVCSACGQPLVGHRPEWHAVKVRDSLVVLAALMPRRR